VREDQTPKLIVKNPNNCVVFCRACSKTCGLDALSFPDKTETTKKIKATRKAEKAKKEAGE
jgi:NAD-dependent dihydropyrimidine dehydrogenase PreA subunit